MSARLEWRQVAVDILESVVRVGEGDLRVAVKLYCESGDVCAIVEYLPRGGWARGWATLTPFLNERTGTVWYKIDVYAKDKDGVAIWSYAVDNLRDAVDKAVRAALVIADRSERRIRSFDAFMNAVSAVFAGSTPFEALKNEKVVKPAFFTPAEAGMAARVVREILENVRSE